MRIIVAGFPAPAEIAGALPTGASVQVLHSLFDLWTELASCDVVIAPAEGQGVNGLVLCAALSRRRPAVILVSPRPTDVQLVHARLLGAHQLLASPINAKRLAASLTTLPLPQ